MASLLEVANAPRQIDVHGIMVDVTGISGEGVAAIMARFPEVGKMFSGVMPDTKKLVTMAPPALSAFIAAGTGHPGDEAHEKIAAKLDVSAQLDLVDEIMRLTFPRGVGPFVKKLEALGLLAQVEIPSVQSSPGTSKSSSPPATKTP